MTQHKAHIDESLLISFLLGEASGEQTQEVNQWLLQSEENQDMFDKLEHVWAESGKLNPKPVAVDTKSAWSKMSFRVDDFEQEQKQSKTKVIGLKQKIVRVAYSAAAVLILTFGIFKLLIDPNLPVNELAFYSQTEVFKGELPDGSNIALNLNTTLTYPEKFKNKERRVKLEGEAFFDVTHKPSKPFIISAGNAFVRVWGTSFNVKAIKGNNIEVSVSTGKVQLFKVDSLSGDTASVFLTAGQKGILPVNSVKPEKLDAELEPDELYWMDKTLVFQDIELNKVLTTLEKYYNVNIELENRMALTCSYTATFKNADINEIIDMLAATFNFQVSHRNNNYVLKGNGCLDD